MGKGSSKHAGKNGDKHSGKGDDIAHVCANCRNFKPGKDGKSGRCGRTDKKREPDAKACGHFDPKKRAK